MPFAAGELLGTYRVDTPVEDDIPGECYRARQVGAPSDAFVKVLARSWVQEPDSAARFHRQVDAIRRLTHPGLARLFEIGTHQGVLYSASEWLEGETLAQKLTKGKLLPNKATGYAAQMARALAAAHEAGLVHADLKPDNIFITRDSRVKIRELGLANLGYSDSELPEATAEPLVVDYAAPEQVRGEPETVQSDVFSLGVILYEMLTGVRPFLRPTVVATANAILTEEPPELPASIAPGLARIVRHCLAKRPEDRFSSASDVAIAIEAFGSLTVAHDRPRKLHRSSYSGLLLAAVAGLCIGAAIGALIARKLLRPVARAPLVFRQLTLSGHDYSPSSSADGKSIAFSSDRDGASRVWLLQPEKGAETPLTQGPDVFPRISADGRAILFIRHDALGDNLYTVPATGGSVRKILDRVESADWSPDSSILWARGSLLGLVDASGKGGRQVASAGKQALRHPRVSPDGKRAAALAGASIFITRLDGTGRQYTLRPPVGAGELSGLAWTSDGENVIYFQSENQTGGSAGAAYMIRQNAATGAEVIFGSSQNGARLLDVTGPGRLIFDANSGRETLEEVSLPPNGGESKPFTVGSLSLSDPAYLASSRSIFFASPLAGRSGIWELSWETGATRHVVPAPNADDVEPFASADGSRLFWSSNREGHFEIFSASLAEPFPHALTHDGAGAGYPSVTRNGEWVVYRSTNPARKGIWKTRPSGVDDTQLAPGDGRWPEVSGDGRFVLYTLGGVIKIASLANGEWAAREIPATGPGHWLPDARSIAFIGPDERGRTGVFTQDIGTADTSASRKKLGGFEDGRTTESFAISPDGRRLMLVERDRASSIVEVTNVPGVPARRQP